MSQFTCPCCGIVSYHPQDEKHGYCGACQWWTADPVLGPPHREAPCEARDATLTQVRRYLDAELPGLMARVRQRLGGD